MEGRALTSGVSRDFEASAERTALAANAALREVSLRVIARRTAPGAQILEFSRPIDAEGWGEIGRVVIAPVDSDTTRVTVAFQNRFRLQPTRLSEAEFAAGYFGDVENALRRP